MQTEESGEPADMDEDGESDRHTTHTPSPPLSRRASNLNT